MAAEKNHAAHQALKLGDRGWCMPRKLHPMVWRQSMDLGVKPLRMIS